MCVCVCVYVCVCVCVCVCLCVLSHNSVGLNQGQGSSDFYQTIELSSIYHFRKLEQIQLLKVCIYTTMKYLLLLLLTQSVNKTADISIEHNDLTPKDYQDVQSELLHYYIKFHPYQLRSV